MRHYLVSIFLLLTTHTLFAQFSVTGGTPYTRNLTGTGIEKIYVWDNLTGMVINYTTDGASVVRFHKYTQSESDKQAIPSSDISTVQTGNSTIYTIRNIEDSKGYFAEVDGTATLAIWVVDYSRHQPQLNSIRVSEADDNCKVLKLIVDKSDELLYYTKGGGERHVERLYSIAYNTLEWSSSQNQFVKKAVEVKDLFIATDYTLPPPLDNTVFTIKGDQFAGIDISVSSPEYAAVSTEAHIVAEQISGKDENEVSERLGGSAPAEIQFYGMGNEPVASYYTWHIYKTSDAEPNKAIARYTDKDISFIFKESGEYLVKLEVADKNAHCPGVDSIRVSMTDFDLDIPNFLLADGTREFKVSYKSIVKFRCTIFNRWGNKIYEWTDPSKGWDGKHKGRYVSPGVYFYIITAEGGDNKTHKRSGDINVLRPK